MRRAARGVVVLHLRRVRDIYDGCGSDADNAELEKR